METTKDLLSLSGLRTRSNQDDQGQRIPGSAEWTTSKKSKADEDKKNVLARRGLRQRSLDDELGRRIPASARWLGERRTPDEQAVAKNTYNRRYDGIRQGVRDGKTTAHSARTAEAPTRSATMGLGAWGANPPHHPALVVGPQGPGGPSALAAARHNLERGETARRGRAWGPLTQRITNRMTGGPNPLLDQVHDAGIKRAENSSIVKTYGRKNRDLKLAMGKRMINNIPNFLQQHQIQPNLIIPISDLTKKGLGAKTGGRRTRKRKSRRKVKSKKIHRRRKTSKGRGQIRNHRRKTNKR